MTRSDGSTAAAGPQASPRHLALFDLDGTLIPSDSDHAFGEFMVRIGWAEGAGWARRNDEFFRMYQAGALDLTAYVDFATAAWRERAPHELDEMSARFMSEVIEPMLQERAFELVRGHQRAGDLCAIVTATNEFVTRPIADALGVAELLAVELERDAQGNVTGAIRGVPTYQDGKVQRVTQWLAAHGLAWSDFARISVYSDSINDLPLLERATDPVATNPSPALEEIAVARGWRILRLFE
jgi:HAD superfamily hydrolase (TIGR01490 family)